MALTAPGQAGKPAAMMDAGPTSHSFVSQRLKLHYVDWGNRDKPPLLLLHGTRDHCRSWDWVARELRNDYHIIAPDLSGHGDSAWVPDGSYGIAGWVYDLAQLIHQLQLAPLTIIAHSLGGGIALRYTGLFPDNVARLVAIEGLGPSPKLLAERAGDDPMERTRAWITAKRAAAARQPKRYASIDDALARMRSENSFLSEEQARHLTVQGVQANEDGSYSWKFDNYLYLPWWQDEPPGRMEAIWQAITCPTLLLYGEKSWASNPATDGRAVHFRNAQVVNVPDAGHWLHHDQFALFMGHVRAFLAGATPVASAP
jgi:pimeloyl-ACP methyl ester carboxylesterase